MLQPSPHHTRRKHGLRNPHLWIAGAVLQPSRHHTRRKHGLRNPHFGVLEPCSSLHAPAFSPPHKAQAWLAQSTPLECWSRAPAFSPPHKAQAWLAQSTPLECWSRAPAFSPPHKAQARLAQSKAKALPSSSIHTAPSPQPPAAPEAIVSRIVVSRFHHSLRLSPITGSQLLWVSCWVPLLVPRNPARPVTCIVGDQPVVFAIHQR